MTTISRMVFCGLLLLFSVGTSRADENVNPPSNPGEYLARAGDCVACHSVPGGKAFAGGLKMGSPLGAIYSTNITPDPETGIGGYSLEDFDRAVRQGIAKDGHRLYPAMPYPSYAKLTDADVAALYGKITIKDGAAVQGNFDTYRMVRLAEAPKIEVHLLPSGGKVWGGAGEPATGPIAAAVANAIFAATGKRIRTLPVIDNDLSGSV